MRVAIFGKFGKSIWPLICTPIANKGFSDFKIRSDVSLANLKRLINWDVLILSQEFFISHGEYFSQMDPNLKNKFLIICEKKKCADLAKAWEGFSFLPLHYISSYLEKM